MNGTLNFFIFNLRSHNFNLWPLSLTSGRTHRYFCRKTRRRLPWGRQMVLREYICIPHFNFERFLTPYCMVFLGGGKEETTFAVRGLLHLQQLLLDFLKIDNSSSLRFIQWTKLELRSFYTNVSSKLRSDPNEKKSGFNSSMRREKEESKKRTIVVLKANYILQDYNIYARTRNTDRQKSN